MTVAERAVDAKDKHRKQKGPKRCDEFWAVFDRDDHPKYKDAKDLCRRKGICVAYSDPCFELWLILHTEAYDKACTRDDVQKFLENLHSQYDRKGAKKLNFTALMDRVEQAEKRAAELLQRRQQEGKPFGNPSTTVGHLTRAIRDASEEERKNAPPAGKPAHS